MQICLISMLSISLTDGIIMNHNFNIYFLFNFQWRAIEPYVDILQQGAVGEEIRVHFYILVLTVPPCSTTSAIHFWTSSQGKTLPHCSWNVYLNCAQNIFSQRRWRDQFVQAKIKDFTNRIYTELPWFITWHNQRLPKQGCY